MSHLRELAHRAVKLTPVRSIHGTMAVMYKKNRNI